MRKRKNFFSSEQFDFSIERFWRSRNYMGTLFGQDLISFLPLLTNVFCSLDFGIALNIELSSYFAGEPVLHVRTQGLARKYV